MKHIVKNLKIWNDAMEIVTEVYEQTSNFPSEEKFGLISQMRRSAVSIPSNIAEGAGRNSNKHFAYFVSVANGSSFELMTQISIAQRLRLLDETKSQLILNRLDSWQRMANAFHRQLLQKAA